MDNPELVAGSIYTLFHLVREEPLVARRRQHPAQTAVQTTFDWLQNPSRASQQLIVMREPKSAQPLFGTIPKSVVAATQQAACNFAWARGARLEAGSIEHLAPQGCQNVHLGCELRRAHNSKRKASLPSCQELRIPKFPIPTKSVAFARVSGLLLSSVSRMS